jgi:predicted ATPase
MIKSVTFNCDWRCFKAGDFFEFKSGVNLLVGDQGTGKSSLIYLFSQAMRLNGVKETQRIASIESNFGKICLFDFEHDNPRIKGHIDSTYDIACKFKSHGQTILRILKEIDSPTENETTFILDEPDMALSIRSINKLIASFQNTKHQIIATAHNPFLIQAFPEVLSLEHKCWMGAQTFIASHNEK